MAIGLVFALIPTIFEIQAKEVGNGGREVSAHEVKERAENEFGHCNSQGNAADLHAVASQYWNGICRSPLSSNGQEGGYQGVEFHFFLVV